MNGARVPFALRLARAWVYLWRFGTLPFAEWLFSRVSCPPIVACRFAGRSLWVDVSRSSTERLLFLQGERLVAERYLLRGLVRPGMSVADVGGNLGYCALLFARGVTERGTVESFEPEPANLALLERTVRDNGLAHVRVHAVAIGAENGSACLEPGLNGQVTAAGTLSVPMRRLDDLFPEGVDFLKIDIEGYEGHALEGARGLLERFRPAIFVELHPELLAAPSTPRGLLADLETFYPEIELWRPVRGRGLFARLRSRYGTGIERIADPPSFLAAVEAGSERQPFWAVGRRP